ncbi:15314_t:CDS:10, partial [Gigaspora margarita]
ATVAKKVPGKCISFGAIPLFDTHHDYPAGCVLVAGKSDKRSREVNQFWELQAKRRNIISEFKLCEEKNKLNEKKQDELRDQICLEQTQLVLDTTKETRSQCVLLQKTVTKKRLLDEPSEKTYNDDDQYDKKTKLSNEGEGNKGYDEKYILSETQEIIADEENNPFLAPKKDVVENSDYNYDYSKDDVENSDHNEDVEDSDYNYDVLLTKALQSMNDDEKLIRGALFKILEYNKDEESRSGKNFMNSLFLNGIIDMANVKEQILLKLEGEQLNWLGNILNKKTWKKTQEFISFCNQFNEDNCDRVNVPVLVRKSFVPEGKFNSFSDEGHDIVQDIMKHFTKSHKFDGIIKIPKIKKDDKYIMIIEFSKGRKATEDKEMDDKIKLGRNAMRMINKLSDEVPCDKLRVYTVQCINGIIRIHYMVRPLPSVYLFEEFGTIKIPTTFDDMEQFSEDMSVLMNFQADVLATIKALNKGRKGETTYKVLIEDTPKTEKNNRQRRAIKKIEILVDN